MQNRLRSPGRLSVSLLFAITYSRRTALNFLESGYLPSTTKTRYLANFRGDAGLTDTLLILWKMELEASDKFCQGGLGFKLIKSPPWKTRAIREFSMDVKGEAE